MPGDFHVIELYRNLCQGTASEDIMINKDQEVPQTNQPPHENMIIKTEVDIYPCDFHDSILEEITSTSFPEPSAGCTTVTEVPDQQLNAGNSPSHFTDLDAFTGTDPTLYDQSVTDMKQHLNHGQQQHEESMDEEIDDVLYYLATKDILEECETLEISFDPTRWSRQNVTKWITHMCKKYCIPDVNLDLFDMNGKCLCLLSEMDFMWRSPHGSQLYAQLEIWKNYFKLEEANDPFFHERTTVDTSYLENSQNSVFSQPPGSPGNSSLDSIPSSAGSSPQRCQTLEDPVFPYHGKSEEAPRRPTEHKQTIHLWQFLKELLLKPESFSGCIKWIDRSKGIFKIEDSGRVAKEWGRRKNRPAMNYDKLSRSIRQYYKKGIIKKTEHSKRLVYQFCAPYL